MPLVRFTPNLRVVHPGLEDFEAEGDTVRAVLDAVDERYPGLLAYVLDEHGALRQHVNVFVDRDFVRDRERLSDSVPPQATVSILQALSGG